MRIIIFIIGLCHAIFAYGQNTNNELDLLDNLEIAIEVPISTCLTCHDSDNRAELSTPNLYGQDEQYLYDKLMSYKQKNNYSVMGLIAYSLREENIRILARYFSRTTEPDNGQ